MTHKTARLICWIGICAVLAYKLISPSHSGLSRINDPAPPRVRVADAFKKVAPLLDKKHYDEAGAILREIAIRNARGSLGD